MKERVIGIIGGGICGLTLAYKLKQKGFGVKVFEANTRLGGRIYTKTVEGTKVELGATWLWKHNTHLLELANELKIDLFPQQMEGKALFEAMSANMPQRFQLPENQEISYRVNGGTAQFIEKLSQTLSADDIFLNTPVKGIAKESEKIKLLMNQGEFYVDQLITTIPPQLLVNSVSFFPELPKQFMDLAKQTHTWMQDSIKCAVTFKRPFWKEEGLSGVAFSHVGPFTELYDHSSFDGKTNALMGFLNGSLVNETFEVRKEKVLQQLVRLFGEEANDYVSYDEKLWNQDPLTVFSNASFLSPHQNNGHPLYQTTFWDGALYIGGTETASAYAGYMEGAVVRALEIVDQID